MRNRILAILIALIIVSCTTVKKTTATLNSGNYDGAIAIALKKLSKNPSKKGKQEYVVLLEDAFAKAKQRDTQRISFLTKEGQETSLEEIYDTYQRLRRRQDRIRPILPLTIIDEGREARFAFENYDTELIATKDKLIIALYASATEALATARTKEDYRYIYDDLNAINKLNPGYKEVRARMELAHNKGIDYVDVGLFNDSQIALPVRLEKELLDFSTYDLDDFWTVYHSNPQPNITYDYTMDVAFTEINISPERVKERELQKEKVVTDGTKYLRDDNDTIVLDEDGQKIEIDNLITVRCTYFEFIQNKVVNVVGRVRYTNAGTNQVLESFPLVSEFTFDHRYATFRGDKRALDDELYRRTRNRPVDFPSNEQMIYDAGEDLKNKIKDIIRKNSF